MQPPGAGPQKFELPNIQYLVAVASGKGGVGKSTVAANLALALHARGKRVGLMDADIYGPSIPTMLGIGDVDPQTTPFPIERHGVKVMSMGFLLGPDRAADPARADGAEVPARASSRRSIGDDWIICWWTCRPAPATPSWRWRRRPRWRGR